MPALVRCPTCALEFVPRHGDGGAVRCPQCRATVVAPAGEFAAADRPPDSARRVMSAREGVAVAVLVSAVANVVVGLAWGSTCIGLVFTVPMAVLSVFEILLWSRADRLSDRELADRAKTLSIFEIVLGVFNTPTLVCGVVALIYSGRLRDLSR